MKKTAILFGMALLALSLPASVLAQEAGASGRATLKTASGGTPTAMMNGAPNIADAAGNVANVTICDVNQSNGVLHVIDRVVLPQCRRFSLPSPPTAAPIRGQLECI